VSVAVENPQWFDRLILVSPVAKTRRTAGGFDAALNQLMRAPVLGEALFNVLASEASIKYYLENQVYADRERIDPAIVKHMYATSHAPNARYAPAAFVAGALDVEIGDRLRRLTNKTLVVRGKEPTEFEGGNPHVRVEIADGAGLLVHDERAEWFNSVVQEFL
jgi:pimeloyl-ACP methyl ester carboxylesterase